MVLFAALFAVASLAWRVRNRTTIDASLLLRTLLLGVLSGWLLSGFAQAIYSGLTIESIVENLSPLSRTGHSITFFGLGAGIAIALALIPQGRRALAYFDALAPSLPLGFAIAKIGCILAGCCAGSLCEYSVAVTYPYGSNSYHAQWRDGLLTPPAELIHEPPNGQPRLLGHAHALRNTHDNPPKSALDHAHRHDMSYDQLVASAETVRSLGVWPTPLAYVVTALLLWGYSEIVFRRPSYAGSTIGLVFCGYGIMRVAFDFFVEFPDPVLLQLSLPQWSGIAALILGLAFSIAGWRLDRIEDQMDSHPR